MAAICKYVNGPAGPVVFDMATQHAMFKALARALDVAAQLDERIAGRIPSTKDTIES